MKLCTSAAAIFALFASALASADEKQPAVAAPPEVEVMELTIHPAAVPRPALRYRLLPPYLDQVNLNAAPLYYKSSILLSGDQGLNLTAEDWRHVVELLETPLADFPSERVQKLLGRLRGVFELVDLAARRSKCDWDTELHESKQGVLGILLPELSSMHNLGRLVALRARANIAAGNYADAVHSLQTGYAMSRHLAEQPFLFSALVGVEICRYMNAQLEFMASQPDAPNLYWAITGLPRPLVSFEKALELEGSIVFLVFPELLLVKSGSLSAEQSDAALRRLMSRTQSGPFLLEESDEPPSEEIMADERTAQLISWAKPELMDRGYSKEQVEAMAPSQQLLLCWALRYEEHRDELFKWLNVPYWQAREGMRKAEETFAEQFKQRPILPRVDSILSSLATKRGHEARLDRDIDLLRVIEAIRLHAADHDGKLPASLAEIGAVPIPVSPITGKPFDYRVEDGVGILESAAAGEKFPVQYRLTLAEAE